LTPFSPDYLVCGDCRTLVSAAMPGPEITRVEDEESDFYGRRYWFEYQQQELGNPDITVRARTDLSDRCVHWLRTVLRHRPAPARALDVGCGHGGFVLLLRRAGYEAQGLELSRWVVDFARCTFRVPVLLGPLEAQSLEPGSLDVITMMDVLEHLPDPVATLQTAGALLGDDGLLVIQTPAVPEGLSWDAMVANDHPLLPLLRERGHLYLFTEAGLRRLLVDHVGMRHLRFEPAHFGAYDMYLVAGRRPLVPRDAPDVAEALGGSADGRLVRALLDLDDALADLRARHAAAERDRAARLEALHELGARMMATEGERNVLRAQLARVEEARDAFARLLGERDVQLTAAEADRAARLDVIHRQAEQLDAAEADRAARLEVIHRQAEQLDAAEADRAARLEVIHRQAEELAAAAAERDAAARRHAEHVRAVEAERDALQGELEALRFRGLRTRAVRALRWARTLMREADGRP
jgi:2-polyprenyl-3-methyl-5-hydroxy-6-metoxy-1,4-benzoquinol methylase